ncbi:hypothetical protein [Streptomyces sp. 891-h]|uniref:hypothetical protein n=1 Tax=Streptomyces sp. 891-h TaxID=2720714 RepID=UPI001FA97A79|nr:hypothetical protein [Streptomyces sp. 891-h]UNZ17796.1 hypothetical protein HC362_12730 [Streptomyces sp. 891-h]
MLNRESTLSKARRFLEEKSKEWGKEGELRIDPDAAFIDGTRFVVHYDSIAYLDHRDERQKLGGNTPIEVDMSTGHCRLIDFEEALNYMERGLIQ